MIRRLPKAVVDRIAAGEVVERPAAVVKELVENALDARATAIDVTIENAGLGLVRVADDGTGIGQEDLPAAFVSHATSKLVDVDDLFHVVSFGFRGEALSSIAAVSRTRIVSATDQVFRTCTHRRLQRQEELVAWVPRGRWVLWSRSNAAIAAAMTATSS